MKLPFALVGALVFLVHTGVCRGAIVSTVFTLDTPSPAGNEIGLQFSLMDTNVGTPATANLTGTFNAELDIDLVTGLISSITLTGGNMTSSGWTVNELPPPLGSITATASPAIAGTRIPVPPDPLDRYTSVNAGQFDSTGHFIRLTGGTAGEVSLANTDIEGDGTGTLTSNFVGGQHEIVFSMNVNDSEPFPISETQSIDLLITGTIVGRTQITAIPEPSGVVALTLLGAIAAVRRRRR